MASFNIAKNKRTKGGNFVDVDFWYSSSSEKALDFLYDFSEVVMAFKNHI